MEKRVYNFSPGPAMLPLPALEEAQRDLLALPGVGISILEISHRSKTFDDIIGQAEANLRRLLAIPDNYRVLFMQGGAQLQFAMVPMNYLRGSGKKADYVLTGSWGKKALQQAKTQGEVRVVWDGQATNYDRIPEQGQLDLDPDAAYVHITSNETIQGVQFPTEPDTGDVPLVCDSSSDFLCRPVPVERYGILYACAQKNAGPAGVTIVIIRDDLVARAPADLPSMLNYRVFAEGKSVLNTPPVFAVYIVKLVTDWLLREIGGLDKMLEINRQKVSRLYETIDRCEGFYEAHAAPGSRSLMNVAFRLASPDLDKPFLEQAEQRGLAALKGHRSVGGCRASIYNAMPVEGVETLCDFMLKFCEKHKA
ncbi:MAG: 3-phosphoserine/phosphohydroxythreonine transaminase [Pirellulales bacterium]|nr:3-phosphoserine/phosphohydroxythreonine transaminase [Pirellulales bacterium]